MKMMMIKERRVREVTEEVGCGAEGGEVRVEVAGVKVVGEDGNLAGV